MAQRQVPPSPDKMGRLSVTLQLYIAPRFHVLQNLLEVLLKLRGWVCNGLSLVPPHTRVSYSVILGD